MKKVLFQNHCVNNTIVKSSHISSSNQQLKMSNILYYSNVWYTAIASAKLQYYLINISFFKNFYLLKK